MTPTTEQVEAANNFNDHLCERADPCYRCIKLAQFLSTRDAEIIAKEAARWREGMREYGATHLNVCDVHRCQSGHPCDCGYIALMESSSSGWLAKHDASVAAKEAARWKALRDMEASPEWLTQHDAEVVARAVELWREAFKNWLGLHVCYIHDDCETRETMNALLSPAPSEEKR